MISLIEECPACNGSGEVDESSCCNVPIDIDGTCMKCGEETKPCKCDDCDGKGRVDMSQPRERN